jgi:hypothetical protein
MIEIFYLILLLLSVILNVFFVVSLKKSFNQIDKLEDWIINYKNLVEDAYNKLKEVDNRGIFEKDDDVGFVFLDLKQIIFSLNKKIITDEKDQS